MRKTYVHLFLIIIAGAVIYSNTLEAPFIWDDILFISDNPAIRDLSNFTDLSGTRYLTFLSFAINYKMNWLDAAGYHIFNIAVHIINAALVYFLVINIFKTLLFSKRQSAISPASSDPPEADSQHSAVKEGMTADNCNLIALFAGLLFVSHPAYTMAVTYITQRSVLLATMFYLLSLVTYIRFKMHGAGYPPQSPLSKGGTKGGHKRCMLYAVSLVSAVLAMKSKEIAFTLPLVILFLDRFFFGRTGSLKKSVIYLIPVLLTLLIIPLDKPQPDVFGSNKPGLFRIEDGSSLSGLNGKTLSTVPRQYYVFTELRVALTYMRLFFLPVNLNYAHEYPLFGNFSDIPVFVSFFILVLLLTLSFILLYNSRNKHYGLRIISFGILWFFINVSMESFFVVLDYSIFEYRLYLPSIGIVIALIGSIVQLNKVRMIKSGYILIAAAAIMILAPAATYFRNETVKDKILLWQDITKKSHAKKWAAHLNLGLAYQERGQLNEALNEYDESLRLKPDHADGHYNKGVIFFRQGRLNDAVREYIASLKIKPDLKEAHNNIANVYLMLGSPDDAIIHYRSALSLDPELSVSHYGLGLAYRQKGMIKEAIYEFQAALRIQPGLLQARQNLESLQR